MIPAVRFRAKRRSGFARQRMNKSGSFSTPTSSTSKVTGWASDGTYPATITNNELVVQGAGACTVTLHAEWTGATPGFGQTIYLYRNGASVASYAPTTAAGSRDITWTGTPAAGDTFAMYGYPVAIAFTVTAATYLELVPT